MNHPAGSATGIDLADEHCDNAIAQALEARAKELNLAPRDMSTDTAGHRSWGRALIRAGAALARATPQHPACSHVWNDFGQLGARNVSWCPRCDTLAWTGKEPAATPQHSVTEQDERADFEVEVRKLDLPGNALNRWPDGRYTDEQIEAYWAGWQWRAHRAQPLASTAATQPEQAGLSEDAQHCLALVMLGYHGRPDSSYDNARKVLSIVLDTPPMRAALAIPASTAIPEGDSFKPVYWFSVLTKCARLLNLPDDEPIPSGVLRAVEALVASTAASEKDVSHQVLSADDGDWYDVPKSQYDRANRDQRRIVPAASEQQASVSELPPLPPYDVHMGDEAFGDNVSAYSGEAVHAYVRAVLSGRATIPSEADERAGEDLIASMTRWGAGMIAVDWPDDKELYIKESDLRAALTHRATTASAPKPWHERYDADPVRRDSEQPRKTSFLEWCLHGEIMDWRALYKAMLAAAPDTATTAADPRLSALDAASTLLEVARRQREEQCTRLGLEVPTAADQQGDTARASGDAPLDEALRKINDIRNSIIGLHSLNWSEHVYPLVAALDAAGYKGMEYPEAREYFGTLLERAVKAEDALAQQGAAQAQAGDDARRLDWIIERTGYDNEDGWLGIAGVLVKERERTGDLKKDIRAAISGTAAMAAPATGSEG